MQWMLITALVVVATTHLAMAADEAPRPHSLVIFPAPWTSPYRVDPKWPNHLVNDENQHLFILNRTGWAYFGCKDPEGFLDRSKALGCNVIRVTLEGQPYLPELGIDLWPWAGTREKPDFTAFNDKYWGEVERRIKLAGEKGVGIDLTLYFTLRSKVEEVDTQRLFWQQTINRLGKYANILTWEIHNEYLENEAFQDAAGNFFAQNDPYHRPVCTSDVTTADAAWPKKDWVTLAINHSCTSSGLTLGSKRKHLLDDWYLAVARSTRSHGKPAWCNESGREQRHKTTMVCTGGSKAGYGRWPAATGRGIHGMTARASTIRSIALRALSLSRCTPNSGRAFLSGPCRQTPRVSRSIRRE